MKISKKIALNYLTITNQEIKIHHQQDLEIQQTQMRNHNLKILTFKEGGKIR